MADPFPGAADSAAAGDEAATRNARRERLLGLLLLGVALVLLASSVTWFGTGQTGVGVGQVFLGAVLGAAGAFLTRRAARG